MDLLAGLTRNLPLTLAVLGMVVLAIVVALVVLVRKRRAPAEGMEEPEAEPENGAAVPPPRGGGVVVDFRQLSSQQRLSSAFRRALSELRRHLGGRDSRYRLPWYVLLGEEGSGKSRILQGSGLNLPLGEPDDLVPEEGEGCSFWFFDRGVVLDVSGEMVLRRDGRSSDERGWRQLLAQLREHRPERPLDGVVLTVPCAALIGSGQDEGQRLAGAAERGAAYFRKLRQAQETLGMLFPVYVLVTGCEEVPGFASFAGQLPEHLRGDLFGWSSPYAPEVAFRPEWVDEAFTLLGAGLHRAQVDAFGERTSLPDPDGLFCFPVEFQTMRDELRVLLSQIFRASTYHEVLPCRGIFFCGRAPAADRRGVELFRNPHAVGESVFVRDTFDRKIFPERDLAHPTSLALLQGGRRLRILQAAVVTLALVSTLGLWWGARGLAKRHENLRVFLLNTAQDLQDLRALRARGETGETRGAFLRDRAFHLFEGMANLHADWFGSVFIPSSWFSDFNSDLRAAVARAYDDIILKTMNQELGRTLDEILAQAKPLGVVTEESVVSPLAEGEAGEGSVAGAFIAWDAPAAGTGDVYVPAVADMPEFQQTSRYVAGLRTLENNANRFNRLRTTKDLKDLNAVAAYLFDRELPQSFFQNSSLYSQALAQVDYAHFEPLPQRPRTTGRAMELSDALFGRLFDRNPAAHELQAAAALVAQASGPSWADGGGAPAAALVELHNRLKRAEQILASPELAWMSQETLDLGKPYQEMLGAARASVFLGPEIAQRIQNEGNDRFQDFRRDLLGIETRATGKLAYSEPRTGAVSLSPQAKLLVDALGGLSYQGLVADTAPDVPAAVALSSRGRVAWDVPGLQRAAALYLPYEDFIQKTLEPFPVQVRNVLQSSSREQLGARMMAQVAYAQRPSPEPDASSSLLLAQSLEAQVANFQAASASIAELMSTFEKLGLFPDRDQVAQAFAAQGEQILADADRLLVLEAPYTPRGNGFDWWDGGKRPGLEAFGAGDEAQLAAYLGSQRADVAEIAERFAQPVIKAFGGRASSRGLRLSMARWTAISEQLGRHKANDPGNSVTGLDELVLKDMLEIEPANCSRRITTRMLAEPADDFFEERRATLRRQLYDRCRELADGHAVAGYRRIEAFFNQRLAGRFPFADSPPGRLDAEADPEDVRELYRLYAAYAPVLRGVPEADRPPAAFDFIDKVDGVRPLFAAFLDDPLRPETPELELAVRFRDQRKVEAGADRIFRWSLASGERVVTHPYSGPAIPWTYGTPIRLELQWAKDSPVIPVESPELPGVLVNGRTAVFEFNNRWSLLALLRTLATPQDDGDPRAETLRLRVATRPEAEPQAAPEMARVFIRLALRPPRREASGEKAEAAAPPPSPPLPPKTSSCRSSPCRRRAGAREEKGREGRPRDPADADLRRQAVGGAAALLRPLRGGGGGAPGGRSQPAAGGLEDRPQARRLEGGGPALPGCPGDPLQGPPARGLADGGLDPPGRPAGRRPRAGGPGGLERELLGHGPPAGPGRRRRVPHGAPGMGGGPHPGRRARRRGHRARERRRTPLRLRRPGGRAPSRPAGPRRPRGGQGRRGAGADIARPLPGERQPHAHVFLFRPGRGRAAGPGSPGRPRRPAGPPGRRRRAQLPAPGRRPVRAAALRPARAGGAAANGRGDRADDRGIRLLRLRDGRFRPGGRSRGGGRLRRAYPQPRRGLPPARRGGGLPAPYRAAQPGAVPGAAGGGLGRHVPGRAAGGAGAERQRSEVHLYIARNARAAMTGRNPRQDGRSVRR